MTPRMMHSILSRQATHAGSEIVI